MQRAFILADEELGPDTLADPDRATGSSGPLLRVRVGTPIAEVERRLVLATLDSVDGDRSRAADPLGVSVKAVYNKLNSYRREEESSVSREPCELVKEASLLS